MVTTVERKPDPHPSATHGPLLLEDGRPHPPGNEPNPRDANGKPPAPGHDEEHALPKDLPEVSRTTLVVISVIVVVLLGSLFLLGWIPHRRREAALKQDSTDDRQSKPVVEVAAAQRSDATTDLALPGDVQSFQSTAIYARTNGYLKRLLVDIGDPVKTGQSLAEIDTPEVDAQLEQAKASLQQAGVAVSRSTNEYEFNKATFDRYQGLSETGGITKQQLEEKRATLLISASSLAAAKASVAAATATVRQYTDLQKFEKVVAPFDGTITARNYDVGALIAATTAGSGKELFKIDQTDTLRVFVNVPQSYATVIKTSQPADLYVRNFPGKPFKGTVTRSTGAIDPSTRTLRLEVDFPNDQGTLYPGMYGQVKFQLHEDHPPLVVPTSAFLFQPDGVKVAIVDQGKVRYRKVVLGRDFGTAAEVSEGLNGEEQIVTNPGERLADGVEVQATSRPNSNAPTPPTATAGENTPTQKPGVPAEAAAR